MLFCDSLLHRANITCHLSLNVMHKLSKFTSETIRKAVLAIISDQGNNQPLFWHLQDWHQDKWRHLDCTALVLFLLGLQQSPWSSRRINVWLQCNNLSHFSYTLVLKQHTEGANHYWKLSRTGQHFSFPKPWLSPHAQGKQWYSPRA